MNIVILNSLIIAAVMQLRNNNCGCTMLLEQIKGFYHEGIYSYWLVVIPCLVGTSKDVYIVVYVSKSLSQAESLTKVNCLVVS